MLQISRYEAHQYGVLKKVILINGLTLIKFIRYVPIKLDQNPGNFLKANTISNQRFFSRMDLTKFLHGVILISRISIFESIGLKCLFIDDVIITRLSRNGHFPIFQSNL